jgi:hypothetical protein
MKGKVGMGKSTLMKHALACQENFFPNHLVVAYFFNARGEVLEKTPLGMLRSIIYQLLEAEFTLYERLYRTTASALRNKNRLGDWKWGQSELKEIVRAAVKQPRTQPLLLLIDALDECDESEVRDVVKFLDSLSRDALPLKICLSSRHYSTITMAKALELWIEDSVDHQSLPPFCWHISLAKEFVFMLTTEHSIRSPSKTAIPSL